MIRQFLAVIIILFLFSCNDSSSPSYDPSLPNAKVNNIPPPAALMFKVDAVYPHDPKAYTQGLEFHNGKLYMQLFLQLLFLMHRHNDVEPLTT
jgi:glutamine cyclotransferase